MTEKEYNELLSKLDARKMSNHEVTEFLSRIDREGIDFESSDLSNDEINFAVVSFAMIIIAIALTIFIFTLDWNTIGNRLESFFQ